MINTKMRVFFTLLLVAGCCLQGAGAERTKQAPLQVSYTCSSIIAGTTGMALKCTFEIFNIGLGTLNNMAVWIGDPGSRVSVATHCSQDSLSSNESYICSFLHPLTQAELDSGKWSSVAKASGFNNDDKYFVKKSNKVTVTWARTPVLDVQMTVTPLVGSAALAGKTTATFTLLVKNIGLVTIRSAKIKNTQLSVKCSQKLKHIAPGATVTCTATYVVKQGDMDLGIVAQRACVKGRGPARFAASYKACASAYLILTQPGKKPKEL